MSSLTRRLPMPGEAKYLSNASSKVQENYTTTKYFFKSRVKPVENYTSFLKIAIVCVRNMNRSLCIHDKLRKAGFRVTSYGTETKIQIKGKDEEDVWNYPVGTPYAKIYRDCCTRDKAYYQEQGILSLLERNSKVKLSSHTFQDTKSWFHVIIACGEEPFKVVIKSLQSREKKSKWPVLLFNFNIEENTKEAEKGAKAALELVQFMTQTTCLSEEVDCVLWHLEKEYGLDIIYTYV